MTVNAVQQYVRGIVDGLSTPDYPALTTYISPPVPGDLTGPAAFVWAVHWPEHRQTAPRGQGFRLAVYDVAIWLVVEDLTDSTSADFAFPRLIDTVMGALRSTPMPVSITDPQTGQVSQIVAVGEDFVVDQGPVRTVEDQRLAAWMAEITATVKEVTQG